MSQNVSRRSFFKTASVASGLMLAVGRAPFSYAQNEKVRVGCIGTGGQGSFHVRDGLCHAKDVDIMAVSDVYGPHQKLGVRLAWISNSNIFLEPGQDLTDAQKEAVMATRKPTGYYDYKEMLEKEELDAVVIATPLHTHYQIVMDALDAGKFVFCEKTMCYEIEQARNIVQKCHDTGKFVQVGHQRRYNPLYNKALSLLQTEKVIGRVNHMDMQWHRNNDWRRPINTDHVLNSQEARYIKDLEHHLNWRMYKESSRGLMTELATHQLDVASWILDALPSRVCGSAGLDYWRDGREVDDNVNLIYDFDITPENRGWHNIDPRNSLQDKEAINKPYTVRLCYSSITANSKKGCSELIEGDQGAFEMTEDGVNFFEEPGTKVNWGAQGSGGGSAEKAATVVTSGGTLKLSNKAQQEGKPVKVDNDKSVDGIQFIQFGKDIKEGGTPKANQMVGLRATIMAMSGFMAMAEKRTVEVDPKWYTFDFPTPDPSVIS
jgi:predicted dehydrogenase